MTDPASPDRIAVVEALFSYPVKSCAPVSVTQASLSQSGVEHDRQWTIINENGAILTQRDQASMSLIQPAVPDASRLVLTAPNMPILSVAINRKTEIIRLDLWGTAAHGYDQGDEAAAWLAQYFSHPARLILNTKPDQASFNDCCPVSVLSVESLADLNSMLSEPVNMSRFRPSVVISGLGQYAEDTVRQLLGDTLTLQSIRACARCIVVNVDQETGREDGPEPLRTLLSYRSKGTKAIFGQYFAALDSGQLAVGQVLRAVMA